jgi:hypothetical protein
MGLVATLPWPKLIALTKNSRSTACMKAARKRRSLKGQRRMFISITVISPVPL